MRNADRGMRNGGGDCFVACLILIATFSAHVVADAPKVIRVETAAQLVEAAKASARQSVEVRIIGRFESPVVVWPPSEHGLLISGGDISFSTLSRQAYDSRQVMNGWYFEPRPRVIISGVKFGQYDGGGGMLKVDHDFDGPWTLTGCRVMEVGSRQFPPFKEQPKHAGDVWYSNVINGGWRTSWFVTNNTFINCCRASKYGHVFYPGGVKDKPNRSTAVIAHNRFVACSGTLAMIYVVHAEVRNNTFVPGLAWDDQGQRWRYYFEINAGNETELAVHDNSVIGMMGTWIHGDIPAYLSSDRNDFSEATLAGAFAVRDGKWVTLEQWRALGHDANSVWPGELKSSNNKKEDLLAEVQTTLDCADPCDCNKDGTIDIRDLQAIKVHIDAATNQAGDRQTQEK